MATHVHTIPELDDKELRKFGLMTGAIVAGLFGLLLPWIWEFSFPLWPWIFFAVFGAWALLAPATMQGVYRVWMRIGLAIGKVTTPIILGIVFYIVIMPVGLVMRLFRWDAMRRKLDSDLETYRIDKRDVSSGSLENPF